MATTNDGGPAFPASVNFGNVKPGQYASAEVHAGMSLRDYFAAHAPVNECEMFLPWDWKFAEPEPVKPEGFDYWDRGGSAKPSPEQTAACEKYARDRDARALRGQCARRVAARFAWADAMLSAREAKAEPTP